jgi:inner membrane protein
MSEAAAFSFRAPSRSMGLKLLLVCFMALLMSIPALLVFGLLSDRTGRAETVARDVGAMVGGPQTFLGPVLAVPYATPPAAAGQPAEKGVFVIFPATADATAAMTSDVRRRGLFKVPVWTADLTFKSSFDLAPSVARAPAGAALDWSRAEILLGASDARGAQADIALTAGGTALTLSPAQQISDVVVNGGDAGPREAAQPLRFFGAAAAMASPDARFEVDAKARFSGARRLAMLAFGKTTAFSVKGDTKGLTLEPSFDGGFLPATRQVGRDGFEAAWRVPFIARGVPAEGGPDTLARLGATALGVSLVEPANPYQAVSRSLKYAPMFIGIVFLTFSLFEATRRTRVHPAQYVLIGLAQLVFYLLLLSIAERTSFTIGFVIAAVAPVGLISSNAGWAFDSRRQGLAALGIFSGLYTLIYVLMRLEDFALLVGSITCFIALALAMWFTRKIDWYGGGSPETDPGKESPKMDKSASARSGAAVPQAAKPKRATRSKDAV